MKKIAVLFSGKGSNLHAILKRLHGKTVDVVTLLTNNPNAGGIQYAKKYNIPLKIIDPKEFETREAYDQAIVAYLQNYQPDLTVLAGFMRILTPVFTEQIRAINLHPSLLPRHKGLDAIKRSYNDEFEEGGVTVHFVNSELDGGEVILQKSIPKRGLSYEKYLQRIKELEKEVLTQSIRKVLYNNF